jgi:hypothetical protein
MFVHARAAASDGGTAQVDLTSPAPIEGPTWGVWIFYAVFAVLLAFEGVVVGGR